MKTIFLFITAYLLIMCRSLTQCKPRKAVLSRDVKRKRPKCTFNLRKYYDKNYDEVNNEDNIHLITPDITDKTNDKPINNKYNDDKGSTNTNNSNNNNNKDNNNQNNKDNNYNDFPKRTNNENSSSNNNKDDTSSGRSDGFTPIFGSISSENKDTTTNNMNNSSSDSTDAYSSVPKINGPVVTSNQKNDLILMTKSEFNMDIIYSIIGGLGVIIVVAVVLFFI